ncbi:MAG: ABC transporter permease, partial [Vulcanimicrobiaceae bacterium]
MGKLRDLPRIPTAVLLSMIVLAVFAPFVSPHDPQHQDLISRLTPPLGHTLSGFYLLGTDELGRDIFANILYGLRVSLLVGFCAVTISVVIG